MEKMFEVKVSKALVDAVEEGDNEKVRHLVENGAIVKHSSLLFDAIKNQHEDMALYLIENGANIHFLDRNRDSMLMVCIRKKWPQTAKAIVEKGGDIHHQNKIRQTALHVATKAKDLEMVKILVQKGADVNRPNDKSAISPFHYSLLKRPREDIALYLIDNGADLNAKDDLGNSALMLCIAHGACSAAYKIINTKCNVLHRNDSDETALHLVAEKGWLDMAKLLVQNGAKVNTVDKRSRTPLLAAIRHRQFGVASFLNEKDAALDAVDEDGNSPLGLTIGLLKQKGAYNFAKKLFDRGCDIHHRNKSNETPLHMATKVGCIKTCRYLIKNGADVNAVDRRNESALYKACRLEDETIFSLLLKSGADPNIVCDFLDTLFGNESGYDLKYIKSLIKHGLRSYPSCTELSTDLNEHVHVCWMITVLSDGSYVPESKILSLLNMMCLAGFCSQSNLYNLLIDPTWERLLKKYPQRKSWIEDKCKKPISLVDMSRIVILNQFTPVNRMANISNLPIPACLKEFLRFSDLDDDSDNDDDEGQVT